MHPVYDDNKNRDHPVGLIGSSV